MPLPRNLRLNNDVRSRLGGQLLRLAHRYDRALSERLARWHLAPTHYELLKLLYAAPDYSLTHSQVAQAMGITLPSVTLAARKLGALRLVGAQRGNDRRCRVLTLTVKGAEMLGQLYDAHEYFSEALFSSIPDAGTAQLDRAIQRLLARLTELEELKVPAAA